MERVGILGGTFDPPHLGHLVLAEYAVEALGLSRVLFVPAGDPPHKRGLVRLPITHRLPMLALALAGSPHFEISRIDVDRPGPHFAVDMIRLLQAELPDASLYFLMGSDSFSDLPSWNRPQELVDSCQIVVLDRPGRDWSIEMHDATLPGLRDRVATIKFPRLGISSTEISKRLHAGLSVRYIIPDAVLSYITLNGLYHYETQPRNDAP